MKAVILAGGMGTRIAEESHLRPKPMIEIGGRPILWHILKIYSSHGINDFIICCGYKGYIIKEYFANYALHASDVTFDLGRDSMKIHQRSVEPWSVTLVDTGERTMTGGRLRRVAPYLREEENFCFTYGDGVADVDISALVKFHRAHSRKATLTAARAPARFGAIELESNGQVSAFREKPVGESGYVNAGFFVLSRDVLALPSGDDSIWEREPLECLASTGQLRAFRHDGFWQPMDTVRDRQALEELWASGRAPWKVWK
jgi:glucose-1-phosphate cytidylyltransferase